MSKHMCRDIGRLKKDLLTMGAMVEESIEKAIAALREQSQELAREVIDGDDRIDRREVEVEEECLKLLALHQPVADDLRFVTAVLKINNDLERMGDLAVNMAERALFLASVPPIPVPPQLKPMMEAVTRMVHASLDAFVNENAEQARRVCAADDEVDQLNRDMIGVIRAMMLADPATIERGLHLFSLPRQLERIADHATNIAEDVVYMVEGEIIRHRAQKFVRTQAAAAAQPPKT
ncbi:MAG: phosphate signaling complex protein PhoU [Planctomycetota bacterium]